MSFSMENVFSKVPRKRSSLMEKKASSRSKTQRVPLSEQLMYLQNHLAEFEASMMERAEEIESKERDIAKLEASMESKERELGERITKVESREELVSKSTQEMEVKEKKLNEEAILWDETKKVITKMVGEKGKDLSGFREMLELIERELEGLEKMSLERKDFEKQCKALELRERELDERFEKLKSKEGEVDEGFKKLELREKVLKKRNVNEMEGKWNDLELQQRRIREAWEAVELERKEMKSKVEQTCMGVELVEKALDDTFHEIGLKEEELREGVRDLESREKRLVEDSKRVELEKIGICELERVLELEKKRMDESCKTLELKMKQAEELSMEIGRKISQAMKLREQQVNERLAMLEMEKAKRVDELRKEMELREQQCKLCDERCQALESKAKEMKEKCRILESNEKEMKEQYQLMESKEKEMKEQYQLMESKRKRLKVEIHYQETKCQIYRLCQAMDGKRLQIFLNERVSEHKSLSRGLGKAFKMWSFTPKLVLGAICRFFPPYLNRPKPDSGAYEASVVRSSCILLLEVFMNTKLRVSESVKSLAFDLAKQWKQDMTDEGETDVVVLGFLLLIAAYELASNFDRSYLRRLYEIVAQHRLAPILYYRLGLSKSKNVSSSSPQVKNGNPRSDSSLLTKSEAVSSASQGKEAQAKTGKLKSAAPRGTSTGVPSTVEGTKNPGKFPTVKNREVSDSAAELVSDAEVCSKDGKRRSAASTSPKQEKRPKIDAKQHAVPLHSTGSTAPAGSVTHPLQPQQSDPQDAKTRISNSNLPRSQVNQPAAGCNQTPTHHSPVHPPMPHGPLSGSQDRKMESAAAVFRPSRGTWPRVGGGNHDIPSPPTPSAVPSHPGSSMYSVWPYQSQRQTHHFGAYGHSKDRNSYRYDYHSRVWR